jgi:ethanolamine utilization protein EutN
MIAFDVLGCGEGEDVLIVTGSTAAAWLGGGKIPIDALIIGSLDDSNKSSEKKAADKSQNK